jgi:hypothetical protein
MEVVEHCVSLKVLALERVKLRDVRFSKKLNDILGNPAQFLGWLPAFTVIRFRLYEHYEDSYPDKDLLKCLANLLRNGKLEELVVASPSASPRNEIPDMP